METRKKLIIVIGGFIFIIMIWIGWVSVNPDADSQTMTQWLSIEELIENDVTIRTKLGGYVYPGSIIISENDLLDAQFVMEQDENIIKVHYYGSRPDLFKDEAEVIVEGIYQNGIFEADNLQTKCASRYEGDLRSGNKEEEI